MSDTVSPPDAGGPDDAGPPQPMPPAPGGPQGGGPGGGGGVSPVLAAIARSRMQAQPSQPGLGTQGGALQKVALAVELLQSALPALGSGSSHRKAVLTALTHLDRMGGRDVPQGAQNTAIQDLMRNQMRNAMLQRLLAARGGGGGGQPGGQPGMSPSTPMPGA